MNLYIEYTEYRWGGEPIERQVDDDFSFHEEEHIEWEIVGCYDQRRHIQQRANEEGTRGQATVSTNFHVKAGQQVFVVYIRHSDVSTSGTISGNWMILGIYKSMEDAQALRNRFYDGKHPYSYMLEGHSSEIEEFAIVPMEVQSEIVEYNRVKPDEDFDFIYGFLEKNIRGHGDCEISSDLTVNQDGDVYTRIIEIDNPEGKAHQVIFSYSNNSFKFRNVQLREFKPYVGFDSIVGWDSESKTSGMLAITHMVEVYGKYLSIDIKDGLVKIWVASDNDYITIVIISVMGTRGKDLTLILDEAIAKTVWDANEGNKDILIDYLSENNRFVNEALEKADKILSREITGFSEG